MRRWPSVGLLLATVCDPGPTVNQRLVFDGLLSIPDEYRDAYSV